VNGRDDSSMWFASGALLVAVLIGFGASPVAAVVIALLAHSIRRASILCRARRQQVSLQ
jgi:hypothetical protein